MPESLGVTLDPLLTFNAHARITTSKLKKRNNALKSLTESTRRKEKETFFYGVLNNSSAIIKLQVAIMPKGGI